MKKIQSLILPILFLVVCFSKTSTAQGNLQFNQVIVYDITLSGTQAITVPAGKVWKIESVALGSSGSSPSVFLRNSSAVNVAHFSSPGSASSAAYPFWLPAGYTGSFANNNPSYRSTVSIIEFNVVP